MSFGFKKKSLPVYTGTTKKIKPEGTGLKIERDLPSDDNGNNGESDLSFIFYVRYQHESIFNFFVLINQRNMR